MFFLGKSDKGQNKKGEPRNPLVSRLSVAEKEGFELVDDFATPSPKVPQSLMYQRFPSFSVFASSLQLPTKTFPVRLAIRLILRLAGRSTRVFS